MEPSEARALTRAAVGYAGWSRDHGTAAEEIGVSKATLKRWLAPSEKTYWPRSEDRRKIATACRVPLRFMEEGFAPLKDTPSLQDQLDRMAESVNQLLAQQGLPLLEVSDPGKQFQQQLEAGDPPSVKPDDNNDSAAHARSKGGR